MMRSDIIPLPISEIGNGVITASSTSSSDVEGVYSRVVLVCSVFDKNIQRADMDNHTNSEVAGDAPGQTTQGMLEAYPRWW